MTKPDTIQIRDFCTDDEANLIGLIRELQSHEIVYYDRMLPPDAVAGWYIDSIRRDCHEHAGHIRIAVHDGVPVGYCVVLTRVQSEDADEQPFDYAYVSELAVAQSARGRGIGKRLLQDAECLAQAADANWLRVSVLARNKVARELYSSYGFADHLINMEKPLK